LRESLRLFGPAAHLAAQLHWRQREHFHRLRNLSGDQGAKQIFEAIDGGAITLPMDPMSARDVDTLDDLARIKETALA